MFVCVLCLCLCCVCVCVCVCGGWGDDVCHVSLKEGGVLPKRVVVHNLLGRFVLHIE